MSTTVLATVDTPTGPVQIVADGDHLIRCLLRPPGAGDPVQIARAVRGMFGWDVLARDRRGVVVGRVDAAVPARRARAIVCEHLAQVARSWKPSPARARPPDLLTMGRRAVVSPARRMGPPSAPGETSPPPAAGPAAPLAAAWPPPGAVPPRPPT